MTTIVTDGYSMAGDGRVGWGNNNIYDKAVKIRRIGNQIIGCSGSADKAIEYLKWCEKGRDREDMPTGMNDECTALHLTKSGVFISNGPFFNLKRVNRIIGIGSGAEFAVGAVMAGATPRQAVKIASKIDSGTGGKITWLFL